LRGFDSFYGFYGGFIDYWTKKNGNQIDLNDNLDSVTEAADLASTKHSAYLFAEKAVEVISRHATDYSNSPMFMYFASQLVHTPNQAPTYYLERCGYTGVENDLVSFCAMNLMLDEIIYNITCALQTNNMWQNTLFVVASDNGALKTTGGNFPFRSAKGSMFRGGQSVPAFIAGPAVPAALAGSIYTGNMHVTG
jgi:arylsulfatase A-like enzyme